MLETFNLCRRSFMSFSLFGTRNRYSTIHRTNLLTFDPMNNKNQRRGGSLKPKRSKGLNQGTLTPPDRYRSSRTHRIIDLSMDYKYGKFVREQANDCDFNFTHTYPYLSYQNL